jgi:hypothetical protein
MEANLGIFLLHAGKMQEGLQQIERWPSTPLITSDARSTRNCWSILPENL